MRFFAVLILLLPLTSRAAILPAPVIVSSDLTFTSADVFRGVRKAQKSFQPTIEVALNDFYLGLWGNFPVSSGLKRVNYYGGVGIEFPGIEFAELDTGLTVHDYPGSEIDRTWELYLGLLVQVPQIPSLSGSVYYFYDFDIESHLGEASLTYMQSLERIGVPGSLDFSVYGGVQGGTASEVESYHYYGGSVSLPFSISAFSTLTGTIGYGTAEKFSFGPEERGKTVFGSIGFSTLF